MEFQLWGLMIGDCGLSFGFGFKLGLHLLSVPISFELCVSFDALPLLLHPPTPTTLTSRRSIHIRPLHLRMRLNHNTYPPLPLTAPLATPPTRSNPPPPPSSCQIRRRMCRQSKPPISTGHLSPQPLTLSPKPETPYPSTLLRPPLQTPALFTTPHAPVNAAFAFETLPSLLPFRTAPLHARNSPPPAPLVYSHPSVAYQFSVLTTPTPSSFRHRDRYCRCYCCWCSHRRHLRRRRLHCLPLLSQHLPIQQPRRILRRVLNNSPRPACSHRLTGVFPWAMRASHNRRQLLEREAAGRVPV